MDYDSGPYTITFTAGTIYASFYILLIDDNVLENNESFMLTINSSSLPSNVTVGDPGQVTMTIEDNDGKKFDICLLILQVASNSDEMICSCDQTIFQTYGSQ